jgi:hypothetical protein
MRSGLENETFDPQLSAASVRGPLECVVLGTELHPKRAKKDRRPMLVLEIPSPHFLWG